METRVDLQEWFGGIDIYIFDQLLKGRFVPGMRVLDAGCGSGRNLVYFLRSGYEVFGVDESEAAIAQVRRMATALAPHLPAENFCVGSVEGLSREPEPVNREQKPLGTAGGTDKTVGGNQQSPIRNPQSVDVVLSSAVLHFARDEPHWQAMVSAMWSVLKPGGIFFARLASTIGMENRVRLIDGRRYQLPDGSDRFLVDEVMLHRVTAELGGEFVEPIKTTVVENMRAMTTWVIRKNC
ncbi:MAG TPA: class I SAM-dependent methyltransferase [Pyrinomonadaceae bacterium]|nr:class I SAM-dependent methyltransferase [Pyrinomonadaceae bacterium]